MPNYKTNTFQNAWSKDSSTILDLHKFLAAYMPHLPKASPVAMMAHLSFAFKDVRKDVANLWFGEYNGIRYMADRLAKGGIDKW